ncbi:hypothetical protein NKH18_34525 [Streptomyces sp. M10(2022)]
MRCGPTLVRFAPGLLTACRDPGGHLVALVREGVRERDGLLVQLGEGDQALGLVEVGGGPEGSGAPAAMTVIPTTATPATSRLRTRTVRLPGSAAGTAPEVSFVLPLLRGHFFCTGARNLDSSTLEAEVTRGHV